jgi:arginine-tRNA-protein transferase
LFDHADNNDEEEKKSGSARLLTSDNLNNPDEFRVLKDEGLWPKYRGGYHMLHRIDGELIAVGVLDYTTEALSSVYLFYDPKFEFLNLGTYCALREIEYCRMIQKNFDEKFKFYYMGLYFQDC